MKKITAIVLSLVLLFGAIKTVPLNVHAEEPEKLDAMRGIDLDDIESGDGVEVEIYDSTQEYMTAIAQDKNINWTTKIKLIQEASTQSATQYADWEYKYATLKFTCKVSSTYSCYPYFYVKFRYAKGADNPNRMESIKYFNIDRNYKGTSKQFAGTLYANLETGKRLYWDLNGDFYENGTTTVTGGGSLGIGETAKANFSLSYSTQFFAYCHKSYLYEPAGLV